MIATISSAQEKKTFTLNDVIPGGDNYFKSCAEKHARTTMVG